MNDNPLGLTPDPFADFNKWLAKQIKKLEALR